jgi:hypothetical protein
LSCLRTFAGHSFCLAYRRNLVHLSAYPYCHRIVLGYVGVIVNLEALYLSFLQWIETQV